MMNPVKNVRTTHNLTMRAFASLAGVTEQNIVKAESGMGASLPPSIVEAIYTLTGQPTQEITQDYENWIQLELLEVVLPSAGSDHMILDRISFINWKNTVCILNNVPTTTGGFCKLFKLHPYIIDKWESGKLKSPPLQLVQRLAHMRGLI